MKISFVSGFENHMNGCTVHLCGSLANNNKEKEEEEEKESIICIFATSKQCDEHMATKFFKFQV